MFLHALTDTHFSTDDTTRGSPLLQIQSQLLTFQGIFQQSRYSQGHHANGYSFLLFPKFKSRDYSYRTFQLFHNYNKKATWGKVPSEQSNPLVIISLDIFTCGKELSEQPNMWINIAPEIREETRR